MDSTRISGIVGMVWVLTCVIGITLTEPPDSCPIEIQCVLIVVMWISVRDLIRGEGK